MATEIVRRDEDEPRLVHLVGTASNTTQLPPVTAIEEGRREHPNGVTENYRRIEFGR
jgi:hypothetical protein